MLENNSYGGSSPREGFRPGFVPKVSKRLYKTECSLLFNNTGVNGSLLPTLASMENEY